MSPARGGGAGRRTRPARGRTPAPRGRTPAPRGRGAAGSPDLGALGRFLRSLGISAARDREYAETVRLAGTLLAERTAGLRAEPRPLQSLPYRGRPGAAVALEDLPVYGLCPHHLVPWFGIVSVRFGPRASLCGADSLARVARELALLPRLQEDFTEAVADAVQRALAPRYVEVRVEARHLCIEMRGEEQRAFLVTEATRGRVPARRRDGSGSRPRARARRRAPARHARRAPARRARAR